MKKDVQRKPGHPGRSQTPGSSTPPGRGGAPGVPGRSRRAEPSEVQAPAACPTSTGTAAPDQRAWLQLKVQRNAARDEGGTGASVVETAKQGVQGSGTALPHAATIQSLFGSAVDVGGIRAFMDSGAASAAKAIGARAYAIGSDVAFDGSPDLHTAAHEAAHVVQQRAGVQLKGNVGETGDAYEQHADAVADAVVAGRSAAPLLAALPSGGSSSEAVQRAKADVSYRVGHENPVVVPGQAVGMYGVGGASHSEQGVWASSRDAILGALRAGDSVDVTFTVDTHICHLCAPWFEDTVYAALRGANQTGQAIEGHEDATFHLHVTVGNNTVEVQGGNTIWPNEIADAPTWNRLDDFDKMDRFLTDNRDEDGDVRAEAQSPHVAGLHASLGENMQAGGISGADVEQCLANAIPDACRLQVAAYNFRDDQGHEDPGAMEAELQHITLFDIMSSGRLGSIPQLDWGQGGVNEWKRQLTSIFKEWLVDWIEENLDDRRIQSPY